MLVTALSTQLLVSSVVREEQPLKQLDMLVTSSKVPLIVHVLRDVMPVKLRFLKEDVTAPYTSAIPIVPFVASTFGTNAVMCDVQVSR